MKILIAEDTLVSNQILESTLQDWGYEVINTMDGEAAWEALQQPDRPRLVLLDWEMPGMSGVDVCAKIRSELDDVYTYVLLLTGKTDQGDIVAGLTSGADDYITKPFDPQELLVRLKAGERILDQQDRMRSMMETLQEAEQLRRTFISSLTHDMRTPLSSQKRAFELMQSYQDEISPRFKLLVDSLAKNNQDLLNLINQLLETFHYDDRQVSLSYRNIDFSEMFTDVTLGVKPLAAQKQIEFVNLISSDFPCIEGDPEQLSRVMTNLIGNAVSQVPEKGRIEISAEDKGDFVILRIQDNGPGIPADMLPHLFERYYLPPGSGKSGSGLGLSICKNIILAHGGHIEVNSKLQHGTCFSITLPKTPTKVSLGTGNGDLLKVLIVEDSDLARTSLKLGLEGTGMIEVVGLAENGRVAISMAEEFQPDLILMDMGMPEMDGIAATRELKKLCPDIKIVFLTSYTTAEDVYMALAAGGHGYCGKDSKMHILMQGIQHVMAGHSWLDPCIAQVLNWSVSGMPLRAWSKSPDSSQQQAPAADHASTQIALSIVEKQLLGLIAEGKSTHEIANILYENDTHINEHMTSILKKLSQQASSAKP